MGRKNQNQKAVRRYLLRQLSDAEQQSLELRLLTDDELSEELEIVEDELIDEYLAEELSSDERARFERDFLASPERKRKLAAGQAIRRYLKSTSELPPKPSRFAQSIKWVRKPFFSAPILVAAGLLIIVGLGLAVWRIGFYQSDVDKGLIALNAAYSQRRPLEARITQLKYAPFTNTRGQPQPVNSNERDFAERYLMDAVRDHPGAGSYHALGKFYLLQSNFDKAIDYFERAAKAAPNQAQIYADLGAALLERAKSRKDGQNNAGQNPGLSQEDLARSLDLLNKALALDPNLLEALFNRALCYENLMLPRQAAEDWRVYLKRDSTSKWAEEARKNLKAIEEREVKLSLTKEELLQDFLRAHAEGNDEAAWRIVNISGDDLTETNIYQQLLANFLKSSSADETQAELCFRALAYLAELEVKRAGDHYVLDIANACREMNAEQRKRLAEAYTQMTTGNLQYVASKLPEAIEAFQRAGQEFRAIGDYPEHNLADLWVLSCWVESLENGKASAMLRGLLENSERHQYRGLVMKTLRLMAGIEYNSNEISKAIAYSDRGLKLAHEIGDLNGAFNALDTLTEFYRSINNYRAALESITRSQLLIDCCSFNHIKLWRHYAILASTFSSAGFYAAAVAYQKEAVQRSLQTDDIAMISLSYAQLGVMQAKQGEYRDGLSSAQLAFNIAAARSSEATGKQMMAYSSLQIGHLYTQSHEWNKAAENFQRAIDLYQNLDFPTGVYQAHKGLFVCHMSQGDNLRANEELQTALTFIGKYRSTILEGENKNAFFDGEQSVYDLAIEFALDGQNDKAKAFDYSEESRARSLLDLLNAKPKLLDESPRTDLAFSSSSAALSSAALQQRIPEQTQIVQYAVLDDRVLIWVLNREGLSVRQKRVAQGEVEAKVREYLEAVSHVGKLEDTLRIGKELFDYLIEPVEPLLDTNKQLCIVPDKILNSLPFSALVSSRSNRYLVADYRISYAPSSTIFVEASDHAKDLDQDQPEKLLSVGGPTFDHQIFPALADLSDARKEAEEISSYYQHPNVLVGSRARKKIITAAMSNFDVIHFATHMIVGDGGLRSKLVLASEPNSTEREGSLEAYEIYSIKLPQTKLVVLSACETGSGDYYRGEGVFSFARPFLVSQVPLVIASMWPVDSQATAKLMTSFHKLRKQRQLSSAAALQSAQLELVNGSDERLRHPYFWAAFFPIGGYTHF